MVSKSEALTSPRVHRLTLRRSAWANDSTERRFTLIITLIHVPLGLLLYNNGFLAMIHPLAVFLIGLYWALRKRYTLDLVATGLAYLIGAEVLWRMAGIPIFWEFGKYATAVIMIVALVIRQQWTIPKLPLIYFVALIPACLITVMQSDPEVARELLSSNLSGPFLLVVSFWFFSRVRINSDQLRRVIFAILIPLTSVASVTLFYSLAMEDIQFTTESNFATSGGFGPNQVSSALGLGVLLSAGSIVLFRNSAKFNLVLGALAAFFAAQCMMTFSRGGIYNAIGGLIVLIIFHFRSIGEGLKRSLPVVMAFVLFSWFVFPSLNNFTGGKLQERFEESGTAGRTEIILSDIEIFEQNPILGVGVGNAREYRARLRGFSPGSHTEFSRLIAEHGSFGLLAITCLLVTTIVNLMGQRSVLGRSLAVGTALWSVLFMFNAGMRLAAPSYLLGLTMISIVSSRRGQCLQRITWSGKPHEKLLSRVSERGP